MCSTSTVTGISNAEARQPGKAPNFSVNWTVGDQSLEVVNATTGKDDLGRPSRLCKHALYSRWTRLHCKVPPQYGRTSCTRIQHVVVMRSSRCKQIGKGAGLV